MRTLIQNYLFKINDLFASQFYQLKMDERKLYAYRAAAASTPKQLYLSTTQTESIYLPAVPSSEPSAHLGTTQPLGELNTMPSRASAQPVEDSTFVLVKEQSKLVLLPNLASAEAAMVSVPSAELEATPQDLLQQGQDLLQQGQLEAAIDCYRQSLQLDPDSVEAYHYLAQALSQQGNLEEAAVCYRRAIELTSLDQATQQDDNPLEVAPAARQKQLRVTSRQDGVAVQDAETAAEEAEAADGEVALPWYEAAAFHLQQGKAHCDLKNWDAAVTACEQAIQLMGPKTAEAYYTLGQALQGRGQLDQAKDSYSKALTLQPETAEVHAYLASVYAEQSQFKDALNCYQQAITIKPDFAGAFWGLGEVWQKLGDRNQATDYWYKALQLEPGWATAREHWRLGTALAEQGKLEQSAWSYQQAIEFDPTFVEAYHNLGIILGKQGKWQEALHYHQQAVDRDPDNAQLWAGLGRALAALEEWDQAIATYQRIIKLNLNGAQGYNVSQHALTQLEHCQKALVAKSYYTIAEGLSQQKKWQEATVFYQQAIERHPNSAQFHASLGKAFAGLEQWQEAIAAYQQAMELAPDKTEYYLEFGDILVQREQLQKKQRSHAEPQMDEASSELEAIINAQASENNLFTFL